MSLDDPPDGMRVELTHEGAEWRPRVPLAPMLVAGAFAGLGAGLLAGATAWFLTPSVPAWLPATVVGACSAGFLAASSATRQTISIRTDAVVVEQRRGAGGERHEFRFTHLEDVRLLPPRDDYSGHELLLVGRDDRLVVGRGAPEPHLAWFRRALNEARARHQRREGAEGKEFFFHRERPEALTEMMRDR